NVPADPCRAGSAPATPAGVGAAARAVTRSAIPTGMPQSTVQSGPPRRITRRRSLLLVIEVLALRVLLGFRDAAAVRMPCRSALAHEGDETEQAPRDYDDGKSQADVDSPRR